MTIKLMKTVALSLVLILVAIGLSRDPEPQHLSRSELKIGGVVVGQPEQEIIDRLGAPRDMTSLASGVLLAYPDLDVYIGVGDRRVAEIVSRGAFNCTPGGVCPGMPVSAAGQAYGSPVVVNREQGSFLEYAPAGSKCRLQLIARRGIIKSLRVTCNP